jgi:hypothetical protein
MAIFWVGTGRFQGYIGPVQDYIDRVVAADVAAGNTLGLEVGVRDAYDVFIRDSIDVGDLGTSGGVLSQANSIIKAAPIMAGAQTLQGALVPLVGAAPTNFNFASGDYNRKTGLFGGTAGKSLNSNRNNNADPQDSNHNAVYPTFVNINSPLMGTAVNATGANSMFTGGTRNRNSANINFLAAATANALVGHSRGSSANYTQRSNGASTLRTQASQTPQNANLTVFGYTGATEINTRIAFYSIGESLDLALLDARVTALINALDAAI